MEWQAVVVSLQIMMLTVGWMLFQKAKGELSAKAAEAPVLNEVKALQRSVKQLLSEMTEASHQISARLEVQCAEAKSLLMELEAKTQLSKTGTKEPAPPMLTVVEAYAPRSEAREPTAVRPLSSREERRRLVYELSDSGLSASAIAREAEMSEGEVETFLALRTPVRA